MDCLIIKKPFLDLILSGDKTWELRGSRTHKRGRIGLIESGSGTIVGYCDLVDSIGPLTKELFENNKNKHRSSNSFENKSYKNMFAWVLEKPVRLAKPIPYKHPSGAIIWVKLEDIFFDDQEQLRIDSY